MTDDQLYDAVFDLLISRTHYGLPETEYCLGDLAREVAEAEPHEYTDLDRVTIAIEVETRTTFVGSLVEPPEDETWVSVSAWIGDRRLAGGHGVDEIGWEAVCDALHAAFLAAGRS